MFGKNKKEQQDKGKRQDNLTTEKNLNKSLNEPKRLSNVPLIIGITSITAFALLITGGLLDSGGVKTAEKAQKEEKPQYISSIGSTDLLEKLNGGGTINAPAISSVNGQEVVISNEEKKVEPVSSIFLLRRKNLQCCNRPEVCLNKI